jgi:hypothetical protein
MMRWKLAFVAILAMPLAASAEGHLFGKGDCSGTGGFGAFGGMGGKGTGHGWFGNHTCNNCTANGQWKGFGFFQPPFQAAPWYLYWPYDQHFQLPAPINAPYFAPQAYGNPAANPYFAPAVPPPAPTGPAAPK